MSDEVTREKAMREGELLSKGRDEEHVLKQPKIQIQVGMQETRSVSLRR